MSTLRSFNSFGGTDIHAVFGDTIFGELQMVSYKIDREKAPVYTMGSPDLRTIARGKRLISGACVFVVFDRDSLLTAMEQVNADKVYLSKDEVANYAKSGLSAAGNKAARLGGTAGYTGAVGTGNDTDGNLNVSRATFKQQAKARLADQLLPFDITLVGANEYGSASKMVIHGVELMTEAGGVSIDDLVIEKQMSFIARSITNWQPLGDSASANNSL